MATMLWHLSTAQGERLLPVCRETPAVRSKSWHPWRFGRWIMAQVYMLGAGTPTPTRWGLAYAVPIGGKYLRRGPYESSILIVFEQLSHLLALI